MNHDELTKVLRRLFDKREVTDLKLTGINMHNERRGFPSTLEATFGLTLSNGGHAKIKLTTSNLGITSLASAESTKDKIKKQIKRKKEAAEGADFTEELKKL